MGRTSISGGVIRKGRDRIQFDFVLDGVRYRPSIQMRSSEANLRRARDRLKDIKIRIQAGTFEFAEEFPDYRDLHKVVDASQTRTCGKVFDEFLRHCEARVARNDLSATTLRSYRKILNASWRPHLDTLPFLNVPFSTLIKVADTHKAWGKKTYNNSISALRRAFAFGYRNHPHALNPASALRCARLGARERPRPDPFRISEAERLIAAIHLDWGEAQGNYDEFRFFTGLRPSEEIALTGNDYDSARETLSVNKARVGGIDRNLTKTKQDRLIPLCPRAASVLARQLALRERLRLAGKVDHDCLFVQDNGQPLHDRLESGQRWRKTLRRLAIRYRKPYTARHTSVSWNLMIGKNPLRVAKEHGHSVQTMWRVYSAWMEGAVDADIEAIQCARQLQVTHREPTPQMHDGVHPVSAFTQMVQTSRRCLRTFGTRVLALFGSGLVTR